MKAMFITGILITALLVALGSCVQAHDHNGMQYDSWCCSGKDCAPAKVRMLGGNKIEATTIHGSAIFDLNVMDRSRLKTSTDGQYHACIASWAEKKARCLYVPAGI